MSDSHQKIQLTITVRVDPKDPNSVLYTFSREGGRSSDLPGHSETGISSLELLNSVSQEVQKVISFATRQSTIQEVARYFVTKLIPREQFLKNILPDDEIILIDSEIEEASALPWGLIPMVLGLENVNIIQNLRSDNAHVPADTALRGAVSALIVGCGGVRYPGIARQLSEVKERFGDRLTIETESVPAGADSDPFSGEIGQRLLSKLADKQFLHFAWPQLELPDPDERRRRAKALSDVIRQLPGLQLVLGNSSNSSAICAAVSQGGAVAVGWAGVVSDVLAADFALYFYQRLVEGQSPVEAVKHFNQDYTTAGVTPEGSVPFLSLPSAQAAGWAPLSGEPLMTDCGLQQKSFSLPGDKLQPTSSGGEVQKKPLVRIESFEVPRFLNPALVINGHKTLERLSLFSSEDIPGARLQIECDTGAGVSTVRESLNLRRGTFPIALSGADGHSQSGQIVRASFPVLWDLLAKDVERRMINFVVTISVEGKVLAEATRSTQWMASDEWLNQRECYPFIPAFIQPESHGVKEVLDAAGEILEMIGSGSDSFAGYSRLREDPSSVGNQVKAIYLALQKKFALDYIVPPPAVYVDDCGESHTDPSEGSDSPEMAPVRRVLGGQQVRFPEEVIAHQRGTCHGLSLLFAACTEQLRIHPVIVLIQGHTFFGYWTSENAHRKFWRQTELRDSWIISSYESNQGLLPEKLTYKFEDETGTAPDLLRKLQETGQVEFVECTCVTGFIPFEEACEIAQETLHGSPPGIPRRDQERRKLAWSQLEVVVDVHRSRRKINPFRPRPRLLHGSGGAK